MFSNSTSIVIILIAFIVVFFKVISSLGFLVFIILSLCTYKIFFKSIQEFKNGLAFFLTPRIVMVFKDESKENLPGQGKFIVWFFLNALLAYGVNYLLS